MKKKFGWNFFLQILFAQGFIPRVTFLYNMKFRINFLHKEAVCNFSFNYKQLFLLRYFSMYFLLFHRKLF